VFITVSVVVLSGFILALLLRFKAVGAGAAVMFGFFLASTGAHRPITQLTAALIQTVSDLSR
jgi:hypothetical protein